MLTRLPRPERGALGVVPALLLLEAPPAVAFGPVMLGTTLSDIRAGLGAELQVGSWFVQTLGVLTGAAVLYMAAGPFFRWREIRRLDREAPEATTRRVDERVWLYRDVLATGAGLLSIAPTWFAFWASAVKATHPMQYVVDLLLSIIAVAGVMVWFTWLSISPPVERLLQQVAAFRVDPRTLTASSCLDRHGSFFLARAGIPPGSTGADVAVTLAESHANLPLADLVTMAKGVAAPAAT